MEVASYLLFRLDDAVYAVPVSAVVEILPLPGISRLDEVPKFVVGMADLHGLVVPVIDLNLRFGRKPKRYTISQCLLILKQGGPAIGIIADAAETVRDISIEEIVPASTFGSESGEGSPAFIQGVVKITGGMVMVLRMDHLLRLSESLVDQESWQEVSAESKTGDAIYLTTNSQEAAVFQQRSQQLSQPLESEERVGGLPLALVRIGAELFGIELGTIREFADLRQLTLVPCCPAHVVGQMNLRGEIVTVHDVDQTLGLASSTERSLRKVVVMHGGDCAAGILVDDLLDVLSLNLADLGPVPSSFGDTGQEHLRGTAMHGARMFSLIDLNRLLNDERLTVSENP